MATTTRRQRTAPTLELNVEALRFFMDTDIDTDRATLALDIATEAAEDFLKAPLPSPLPHNIRQGILLLAARLVLLETDLSTIETFEIPLVSRGLWRLHAQSAA